MENSIICPLCSDKVSHLIYTNSRGNKYLENYCCQNCGFVFTHPRLNEAQVELLYLDGEFSQEARKLKEPDLDKYVQVETLALERLHQLERHFNDFFDKKRTCLEIGCGAGSFLWLLKNRGMLVYGIEPDKGFSMAGSNRYEIHIEPCLLEDFQAKEKYDLVANFHVIEHIVDPRRFVRSMRELLTDDGLIYIECPTIDEIYTGSLDTFFWDVHVNTFSNHTLPWLLELEGFEVLKIFSNRGFISVIARKGYSRQYGKDDPSRIKEIVRRYSIKSDRKTYSTAKKGMRSILSKIFSKIK